MTPEAIAHLRSVDDTLGQVIDKIGACQLKPERRRSPFESLVRAVAHQQLHGTAAGRILDRFVALFPGPGFPKAAELLQVSDEQLRAVGFSRSKIAAIRDIAAKAEEGIVPASRVISRLDDDAIVERLTQCRGVGRWTVEMLLIFKLGRPDVLPVDDFGIRQGFQLAYRKREFPKPKDLLKYGERWRPYRTTASWYLWRAADAAKAEKLPKKP